MNKLNILLSTMLLCFFLQSLQAQKDNFKIDYLERFENSRKYLILVAESMPDSNYSFRPVPAERTFAEQLLHIALDWHAQTLIGDRKEGVRNEPYQIGNRSKQEIIKIVNQTFDEATRVITLFDMANYEKRLDYIGLSRSKRQIFLLLSDHITHHRAQLLVYLRLKNVVPPRYVEFQ